MAILGAAAVGAFVACNGASPSPTTSPPPAATTPVPTPSETTPSPAPSPEATATESSDPRDQLQPGVTQFAWKTDLSKHTVPLGEIAWGGVPPRGIPAITEPQFVPIGDARAALGGTAPVIAVEVAGDARAYPQAILLRHEIVNDVVGGVPVAVTYCPLCNSALVFARSVEGEVLEFHVSGNLRFSDLVMFDSLTESWWQQITGEAIVGSYAGAVLEVLPSMTVSLDEFARAYPTGNVLSPEDELLTNPYYRYDDLASIPFLFGGAIDPRLPAMMRVAAVQVEGDALAIPFDLLAERRVVNATVGGEEIIVLYTPGLASVLDARQVQEGRDVGQVGVFRASLAGAPLSLTARADGDFTDADGNTWSIAGVAIDGPAAGARLAIVPHGEHFWFAWAAFHPETRVIE